MDPFIARNAELLVGPVRGSTQVLPVVDLVLFAPSPCRGPEMISSLLFRVRIEHVILHDLLSSSSLQTWMSGMILVSD